MKRKMYTDEQIANALRQAESDTPVTEICQKLGISQRKFFIWRRKFAGVGAAELRELWQLRELVALSFMTQQRGMAPVFGTHPSWFGYGAVLDQAEVSPDSNPSEKTTEPGIVASLRLCS